METLRSSSRSSSATAGMVMGGGCLLLLFLVVWKVFRAVLWEPWIIKRALEKQGVKCLPYTPLLGNLRDISRMVQAARAAPLPLLPHRVVARVAPHYDYWKKTYGDAFVFWLGFKAMMPVSDPQLVKEVLLNKCGHFRKPKPRPEFIDLIGADSVGSLEGERWVEHRRIVAPAFFVDKLKVMTPTIAACVNTILDKWQSQLAASKEIDVHEGFKEVAADIIAHIAFGSSYEEGRRVFKLQREQQMILVKRLQSLQIPGLRYLPTPASRYARRLKSEIQTQIDRIIRSRSDDDSGDDLLGVLMAANRGELAGTKKKLRLSMKEIADECKTFFFAGHETTATLMTWTTMLLAINPEWQERTREEVLQALGSEELPTYSLLHSLKTVGMVLNEALRLYPPLAFMMRETTKETKLGGLSIPSNVVLMLAVADLHCNPALWGKDALDFNPQRFMDGVGSACSAPIAFSPFSMGPHNCLGQNFAMTEARAILAMMLRRFRFSLSPGYSHCPTSILTVQPQLGMPIIFERL